jgi:magnesium transporter
VGRGIQPCRAGCAQNGSVLTATGYRAKGSETLEPHAISDFLTGDDGLVWVDVVDPGDTELDQLEHEFFLHPLAIEDAREQGQRPKIERYPTHSFVVLYSADPDPSDLPEVHLFAGDGWVVTLRFPNEAGRCADPDLIRSQFERTRGTSCSSGFLVYTILDVVVDGYFDVVDALDGDLIGIEDDLFVGINPDIASTVADDVALQQRLLAQRRTLVTFRRKVVPMREVLNAFSRREYEWIDDETLLYVQDVLDHLLRLVDQLDAQRELVGNAVDAYVAMVSNRSNEIMKKMTSWGAILLGSTLIAGIYGMNFRHMPELGTSWGYPGALLLMATLTGVLFVYFRRKRWI